MLGTRERGRRAADQGLHRPVKGGSAPLRPATCTVVEANVLTGDPDSAHISPSCVGGQNLTMRTGGAPLHRLANEFCKKVENLTHAASLHYMHYNFARPLQTLPRNAGRTADHHGDGRRLSRYPGQLLRSPRCSTDSAARRRWTEARICGATSSMVLPDLIELHMRHAVARLSDSFFPPRDTGIM